MKWISWVALAAVALGCGGPEAAFVGRYRADGALTWEIAFGDGARVEEYPSPAEFVVEDGDGALRVVFGACSVPVAVESVEAGAFLVGRPVCSWSVDAGARYEFVTASLRREDGGIRFRAAGNLRLETGRGVFDFDVRLVRR